MAFVDELDKLQIQLGRHVDAARNRSVDRAVGWMGVVRALSRFLHAARHLQVVPNVDPPDDQHPVLLLDLAHDV